MNLPFLSEIIGEADFDDIYLIIIDWKRPRVFMIFVFCEISTVSPIIRILASFVHD